MADPAKRVVRRVAELEGPEPGDGGAYWRALAAWEGWHEWVDPERVVRNPDWLGGRLRQHAA